MQYIKKKVAHDASINLDFGLSQRPLLIVIEKGSGEVNLLRTEVGLNSCQQRSINLWRKESGN